MRQPAGPARTLPAMVGYSGTPLPRKLDVKAGHRVLLDRAVNVCAVDDVWSGLKLVIRLENR